MSTLIVNDSSLTTVADAIRAKGGTSAALSFPDGMVDAINAFDSLSIRKSVVVEVDKSTTLNIPVTGLTTLQYLCVNTLHDFGDNQVNFFSPANIYIYASSNQTSSGAIFSYNWTAGKWWHKYGSISSYISMTKYTSSIELNVNSDYAGYFSGRYSCEIFGG